MSFAKLRRAVALYDRPLQALIYSQASQYMHTVLMTHNYCVLSDLNYPRTCSVYVREGIYGVRQRDTYVTRSRLSWFLSVSYYSASLSCSPASLSSLLSSGFSIP